MAEQKWPNMLILVRHGESVRNLEKERAKQFDSNKLKLDIDIRDMDIDLTKVGREQALAVGKALKSYPKLDAVIVSPYVRCKQTADLILSQLDYKPKTIVVDERVREKEFGQTNDLTKKGIKQFYPREFERMELEGKYYYRPPGGENYPDVGLRLHSFLGMLVRSYSKENVLVVCHSVVIRMLRKLLEKFQEKDVLEIEKLGNASITTYVYSNTTRKLALKEYNKLP